MGDPAFDLGNFSINHELDADGDAALLAAYAGEVRPAALARITPMRVLSDFREAMWVSSSRAARRSTSTSSAARRSTSIAC